MLLYNISGDPASKIFLPQVLSVELKRSPEGPWTWSVSKPAGAGRLWVQFREAISVVFPSRTKDASREEAERLFTAANARLAFHKVVDVEASGKWQGKFPHQPGTLRFIAETPDGWQAFGADLR